MPFPLIWIGSPRRVALKFLPEEWTRNPEALARFEREARAVAGAIWAAPITYMNEGRQFVAIAAGSAIVVFGLDK